MSTKVELWNNSGNKGGACTVRDWQVETSTGHKTSTLTNLMTAQTETFDLSQLGWDQYKGQSMRIRADISGGSTSIHSSYVPYQLNTTYKFELTGPSTNASIGGPI
jgi:hypothetical protein